jgi:hypothetical protein
LFGEWTVAHANPALRRSAAIFGRGDIFDTRNLSPGVYLSTNVAFLNRKPSPFKTGVADWKLQQEAKRVAVARGSVVAYHGGSR